MPTALRVLLNGFLDDFYFVCPKETHILGYYFFFYNGTNDKPPFSVNVNNFSVKQLLILDGGIGMVLRADNE